MITKHSPDNIAKLGIKLGWIGALLACGILAITGLMEGLGQFIGWSILGVVIYIFQDFFLNPKIE